VSLVPLSCSSSDPSCTTMFCEDTNTAAKDSPEPLELLSVAVPRLFHSMLWLSISPLAKDEALLSELALEVGPRVMVLPLTVEVDVDPVPIVPCEALVSELVKLLVSTPALISTLVVAVHGVVPHTVSADACALTSASPAPATNAIAAILKGFIHFLPVTR
jgi:hypothetical protein